MEKRLILNSWKEIADYMGRGVRTVQRYEQDLRLPVHRPAGKSRSSVIAFADEIDLWMRHGPSRSDSNNGNAVRHARTNLAEWHRLLANSELLLKRANALKMQMGELSRLIQEAEKRRRILFGRGVPRQLSQALAQTTDALQTTMKELSPLTARGDS